MRRTPSPRLATALATTGAALLALTACTPPGVGTEVVSGVRIVKTYEDFAYYNPCANEPVEIGGDTYYPLLDEEISELDRDLYVPTTQPVSSLGMGLVLGSQPVAIAPPGPGDDTGTMTVYDDGVARFVTDNGETWWFNDQEHTYEWVC